jgi:hypothetical protein
MASFSAFAGENDEGAHVRQGRSTLPASARHHSAFFSKAVTPTEQERGGEDERAGEGGGSGGSGGDEDIVPLAEEVNPEP